MLSSYPYGIKFVMVFYLEKTYKLKVKLTRLRYIAMLKIIFGIIYSNVSQLQLLKSDNRQFQKPA